MRRRKFLAGTSAGIIISVTGCLENTPLVEQSRSNDETDQDTSDDETDQDTSDDETDQDTSDDETEDEYEYEAIEGEHEFDGGTFTIKQFGGEERRLHHEFQYNLKYFADAQQALNYFEDDPLTDELRDFITETDYSQERLLFIWTAGSNPGFGYIMIRSFSLTDDTLVGRAAGYAEKLYSGPAGNRPAAFIRVTFDEKPVETAEFTIVEGQSPGEIKDRYVGGGTEYTREASTQNE